jgi:hypothetical protein
MLRVMLVTPRNLCNQLKSRLKSELIEVEVLHDVHRVDR